jgi:hypothetical protein
MDALEVTPMHQMQPKLEWCGRLYGKNIFVDTSRAAEPEKIRKIVEDFLINAIESLEKNGQ